MKKETKVVLVTGAASGIGHAITEFLVEKGETVIATDFIAEGLEKYNNQITHYLAIKENITKEKTSFRFLWM